MKMKINWKWNIDVDRTSWSLDSFANDNWHKLQAMLSNQLRLRPPRGRLPCSLYGIRNIMSAVAIHCKNHIHIIKAQHFHMMDVPLRDVIFETSVTGSCLSCASHEKHVAWAAAVCRNTASSRTNFIFHNDLRDIKLSMLIAD